MMDDLIAALLILKKYIKDDFTMNYPTNCVHDALHVNVEYDTVFDEDKQALEKLSFVEDELGTFKSYRFGSN